MTDDQEIQPSPSAHPPHAAAAPSGERVSGYEVADKVASGAGMVAHGIGWLFTKVWGLILIAGGVFILANDPGGYWWVAVGIVVYGIYLVLPGGKTVVW